MKTYKGRPIVPGSVRGEALVSRQGLNWLATFQESIIRGRKTAIGGDRNNPYVYRKVLTNKILVIPTGIGSTTGSLVLVEAVLRGIAPKAIICTRIADTLTVTGAIIAYRWFNRRIVLVDSVGDKLFEEVGDGDVVEVYEDGTVKIVKKQ